MLLADWVADLRDSISPGRHFAKPLPVPRQRPRPLALFVAAAEDRILLSGTGTPDIVDDALDTAQEAVISHLHQWTGDQSPWAAIGNILPLEGLLEQVSDKVSDSLNSLEDVPVIVGDLLPEAASLEAATTEELTSENADDALRTHVFDCTALSEFTDTVEQTTESVRDEILAALESVTTQIATAHPEYEDVLVHVTDTVSTVLDSVAAAVNDIDCGEDDENPIESATDEGGTSPTTASVEETPLEPVAILTEEEQETVRSTIEGQLESVNQAVGQVDDTLEEVIGSTLEYLADYAGLAGHPWLVHAWELLDDESLLADPVV